MDKLNDRKMGAWQEKPTWGGGRQKERLGPMETIWVMDRAGQMEPRQIRAKYKETSTIDGAWNGFVGEDRRSYDLEEVGSTREELIDKAIALQKESLAEAHQVVQSIEDKIALLEAMRKP